MTGLTEVTPRAAMGVICLAVAAVVLAAGCAVGAGAAKPSPSAVTPTDAASTDPGPEASTATDGCGTLTVSVDYVPLTVSTMAGLGWTFVEATVDRLDDAAFNTSDGKAPTGYGTGPSQQG